MDDKRLKKFLKTSQKDEKGNHKFKSWLGKEIPRTSGLKQNGK